MLKPHGYVTITDPDAPRVERDTITCNHCQALVFVKPGSGSTVYLFPQFHGPDREEMGAFCRVCMSPICLRCHDKGTCTPFARQMEISEARDRLRRSVGV